MRNAFRSASSIHRKKVLILVLVLKLRSRSWKKSWLHHCCTVCRSNGQIRGRPSTGRTLPRSNMLADPTALGLLIGGQNLCDSTGYDHSVWFMDEWWLAICLWQLTILIHLCISNISQCLLTRRCEWRLGCRTVQLLWYSSISISRTQNTLLQVLHDDITVSKHRRRKRRL